MISGSNHKWIVVLLFVVVAAAAKGAATLDNYDRKLTPCNLSPVSNAHNFSVLERNLITEIANSHLPIIAGELLKPPASFIDSSVRTAQVISLPPVPGALFMALVGFLCVSLIRDRKVWLAVATTILWAGHIGITTLPRLASHLAGKKQFEQQTSINLTYTCELENVDRLRSDIDGTQYIGLLHYLEGIPAVNLCPHISPRTSNYELRTTNYAPQFVIIGQLPYLPQVTNCLATIAKQFTCFSPAFIFANLPRGPPQLSLS